MLRTDEVLTHKERQFLLAVERGDMATTKTLLETAEVRSTDQERDEEVGK